MWKETLPPQFQRQAAGSYGRCVQLMGLVYPSESIAGDWESKAARNGRIGRALLSVQLVNSAR